MSADQIKSLPFQTEPQKTARLLPHGFCFSGLLQSGKIPLHNQTPPEYMEPDCFRRGQNMHLPASPGDVPENQIQSHRYSRAPDTFSLLLRHTCSGWSWNGLPAPLLLRMLPGSGLQYTRFQLQVVLSGSEHPPPGIHCLQTPCLGVWSPLQKVRI